MTKQISNILALIAIAGFAACATGCKCICRTNNSAAIPIILRQPADQEVFLTNDIPQTAVFHVAVKSKSPLRFAWFKVVPTETGYREIPLQERMDNRSNTLRIENVSTNDRGLYYCGIVHETDGPLGDIYTRTRLAELKVYAPMLTAMSNMQLSSGQLQGAVPGKNSCVSGEFAASIPFPKDDNGQKFDSKTYSTCDLTVTKDGNSTPLQNTEFWVRWITPLTSPQDSGCTDALPDLVTRHFKVKHAKTPHTFVVYLKNPAPTGTTFELTATWN